MSYVGIETNKKFVVIGIVIVVVVALIVLAANYDNDKKPKVKEEIPTKVVEAPQRPGDADTIANTVENILVLTNEQKDRIADLESELAAIKAEQDYSQESLNKFANQQNQTNQAIVGEVEKMLKKKTQTEPKDVNVDQYPVVSESTPKTSQWVDPIETVIYRRSGSGEVPEVKKTQSMLSGLKDKFSSIGDKVIPPAKDKVESVKETVFDDSPFQDQSNKKGVVPVYTIPKNATIFNSYLATSLVGRLPTNNQLSNPYRFKILTGPEGISSNSIELPEELSAMTFSGTAVGDWGLSCASGKIDSVTFTFNDGEIVTIDGKGSKGIGWISDEFGQPCIKGTKVSDSKSVLTKRILAGALTSGADTYSRAQTDTVITNSGVAVDIEDANKYAGYKAISGGARELERHLDRRLDQIFEAIYVPNGAKVMIHIEQSLEINRDKKNRKVRYDEKVQNINFD